MFNVFMVKRSTVHPLHFSMCIVAYLALPANLSVDCAIICLTYLLTCIFVSFMTCSNCICSLLLCVTLCGHVNLNSAVEVERSVTHFEHVRIWISGGRAQLTRTPLIFETDLWEISQA